MRYAFRNVVISILVGWISYSGNSVADVAAGIAAIERADYATALRELRPLAERGNAVAQYRVGWMYEFGSGVPKDKARAPSWYHKSADQGDASAQLVLGVIYATADGVPGDDAQSVAWFHKAATQGNATAQFDLAMMYAKGRGAPEDLQQALTWFHKAAEQGNTDAQFKLGVAYEFGEGVAKDTTLAYANYAIAARDGEEKAVARRDAVARLLNSRQLRDGGVLASAWDVGQPMPVSIAAVKEQPVVKQQAAAKEQPAVPTSKSQNAGVPIGNDAKGMLVYKTFSVPLKYAWLAKGPYTAEPSKIVRRLFLSSKDIGAALQACKTISCADGQVTEGMTVDFDVSPRLNYWISVNGQKVQWSGAAMPDAFTARVNEAGHLAGSLVIDDVAMGGPKIDAEFNVTLLKEFPRER